MFQRAITKPGRVEANTFSSGTIIIASNKTNVRMLVSFYLTPRSSKVDGQPIHKEKLNVPVDKEVHKELHKFKKHFANLTSVYKIARSKGLGANPEVNFTRINSGGWS